MSQESNGIQEMNRNTAQSSTVAEDMTLDISEVNQSTENISNCSEQINLSAKEMSKLADRLKEMVDKFKV